MKKCLKKNFSCLFHYVEGIEKEGGHDKMTGNCSGLSGNCCGLQGDCSGLSGDLDEAGITQEERENGIDIDLLVQ